MQRRCNFYVFSHTIERALIRCIPALLSTIITIPWALSDDGEGGSMLRINDWENPAVNAINRDPMRATFGSFPDEKSALTG